MGATKDIVQNRVDFVNFCRYPMGSQIIVLGNDDEENVLKLYHLKLREGTAFLLLDVMFPCVFYF